MVSDPKIVQYVEELDLLIIRDGGKLYHITGDVITGMWKAYAEGHGIDYDICEGCECVDPETAEQKHGRWLPSGKGDCTYICSECGFVRDAYVLEEKAFCPHCGAKMDEPEAEP